MITTARLELHIATGSLLQADLDGPAALAGALNVMVPTGWPPDLYDDDAIRHILAAVRAAPTGVPWGLRYLILVPPSVPRATLVGTAGFKGPPDEDGGVELGYGVVTEFQRRGIATEAVRGLVQFAFGHPEVSEVVGQTLQHLTPSIGVLERAGFRFAGEGSDPYAPEGEVVVRYVLPRAHWAAQGFDLERD